MPAYGIRELYSKYEREASNLQIRQRTTRDLPPAAHWDLFAAGDVPGGETAKKRSAGNSKIPST